MKERMLSREKTHETPIAIFIEVGGSPTLLPLAVKTLFVHLSPDFFVSMHIYSSL
jgi:hypothetical protein